MNCCGKKFYSRGRSFYANKKTIILRQKISTNKPVSKVDFLFKLARFVDEREKYLLYKSTPIELIWTLALANRGRG